MEITNNNKSRIVVGNIPVHMCTWKRFIRKKTPKEIVEIIEGERENVNKNIKVLPIQERLDDLDLHPLKLKADHKSRTMSEEDDDILKLKRSSNH